MKDYSATIRIEVTFQASNDEQAQERAEELADAYGPRFTTPAGKDRPAPAWVGDVESQTAEDVECQE